MPGPLLPQILSRELLEERDAILAPCRPDDYRVLSRLISNPGNHLAVSFGGGGVPALAGNVALIQIIEELGLHEHVREVWGTSAGAIVGASWASGYPVDAMLETIEDLNRKGVVDISRWEILVKGLFRLALFRRLPEGLIRGRYFHEMIERCLAVGSFEELAIPLRIVSATDDGRALKVVHRHGPLINAIEASICLPGVAMPVPSWTGEDYGYIDGGVVEKTPLLSIIEDHKRLDRREDLVILCTRFVSGADGLRPRGFVHRFISAMSHLENELWNYQAVRAQGTPNCRTIVVNPRSKTGDIFDFQYVRANYLISRRTFKDQLSNAAIAARFDAR